MTLPTERRAQSLSKLGPGIGLVVFGAGVLLTEYWHATVRISPPPDPLFSFFQRYLHGDALVVILVVVAAPLIEELIFRRGLLMWLLTKMHGAAAVGMSTVIFTVVHWNVHQLLPAACMGALLGWLYVRTRSYWVCAAAHALWNSQWWIATAVLGSPVSGYSLVPNTGRFPEQPIWWLVLAGGALIVGLVLLYKRLEHHPQPT